MQLWKARLLHKADLIVGEGAIWHPWLKKYLYVDIEGKILGAIDPINKSVKEIEVNKRIGAVVPATNGNLIIALQGSIDELNFETGVIKQLVEVESGSPGNRCNEGKCDASGRLWVGTMHVDGEMHKGTLYCFDGLLRKKIGERSVSNGVCWSRDNRTMYYIDSFDHNIKAYDFDLLKGNISNEQIVVDIKEDSFLLDGMTIDEEGMLWVAIWGNSCVCRYNPFDGSLIGKVIVDAPHVTSCTFGGENLQSLFITSARQGLNQQQLEQFPLSGSLFIAETGIKGASTNFFKNI